MGRSWCVVNNEIEFLIYLVFYEVMLQRDTRLIQETLRLLIFLQVALHVRAHKADYLLDSIMISS